MLLTKKLGSIDRTVDGLSQPNRTIPDPHPARRTRKREEHDGSASEVARLPGKVIATKLPT
jgi:hypothetical protein